MQHSESSTKVYFSKEYGRFNMINGNRQLNQTKINKIKDDIDNGNDLLRYCPIIVAECGDRLNIIDGQHRFWVAKSMKSPVWYIVAEEMSLYDIAKMNSNTEKWKAKDFINCYVQLGNQNYQTLEGFLDKFPIPHSTAISLLLTGKVKASAGNHKVLFEQGKFEVKFGRESYNFLETISRFEYADRFNREFMSAVQIILTSDKIKKEELIEKLNAQIDELKHQPDYKHYLTNIEAIFNKGKHSRVIIY